MHPSIKLCSLIAALGLTPLCAPIAHAALGGDATSVTADAKALHGTLTRASLQYYEVHEITDDNGTHIRELLNRDGIVFAVLWNSPATPDLKLLLGKSYATYVQSLTALPHPGLRRSLKFDTPELVVESEGHMRAYSGRAFLPTLIPAGATPATIR